MYPRCHGAGIVDDSSRLGDIAPIAFRAPFYRDIPALVGPLDDGDGLAIPRPYNRVPASPGKFPATPRLHATDRKTVGPPCEPIRCGYNPTPPRIGKGPISA
jgi:hypothetical protein